jgi:hypothetical protein
MSDLETRLTAALHADEPPARDALFRVEILVRLEQARFRRRVARAAAVAATLAVVAAIYAPVIDAWITADPRRPWFIAVAAAAALCALSGWLIEPRLRTVAKAVGRLLYP